MSENDNKFEIDTKSIIEVISSESFGGLSTDIQNKVLNSIGTENDKDGGIMGKFFGNKKENASMNIAFVICVLLACVGIICMALGNECWDVIIPAIMTAVGYMFGVGVRND